MISRMVFHAAQRKRERRAPCPWSEWEIVSGYRSSQRWSRSRVSVWAVGSFGSGDRLGLLAFERVGLWACGSPVGFFVAVSKVRIVFVSSSSCLLRSLPSHCVPMEILSRTIGQSLVPSRTPRKSATWKWKSSVSQELRSCTPWWLHDWYSYATNAIWKIYASCDGICRPCSRDCQHQCAVRLKGMLE